VSDRPGPTRAGAGLVAVACVGAALVLAVRLSTRLQKWSAAAVAVAGVSDLLMAALVVLAGVGAVLLLRGPSRRLRWWAAAALVPLVALGQMVWPTAVGVVRPEDPPAGPRLRIAAQNLWIANPDPDRAALVLRSVRADVLILTEFTPPHAQAAARSGLLDDYPYKVVRVRSDPQGMAVLSKVPLQVDPSDPSVYRTVVTLRPPGARPVPLIAVHVPAPVGGSAARWADFLRELAIRAAGSGADVVVAGDFNADSGHAPFRRVASLGHLRDAQDAGGGGFGATWSAVTAYPPLLRLDHVMVGRGPGVATFDFLPSVGSDHRGIIAGLRLRAAP
jgi:endonuclease/exonuclease/phosphatase family metal-dependent hydrolase